VQNRDNGRPFQRFEGRLLYPCSVRAPADYAFNERIRVVHEYVMRDSPERRVRMSMAILLLPGVDCDTAADMKKQPSGG
jgi:hypothetical protein